MKKITLFLLTLILTMGLMALNCGSTDSGDSDTGHGDGGVTDGSTTDTFHPDGGGTDSGLPDSGTPDTGAACSVVAQDCTGTGQKCTFLDPTDITDTTCVANGTKKQGEECTVNETTYIDDCAGAGMCLSDQTTGDSACFGICVDDQYGPLSDDPTEDELVEYYFARCEYGSVCIGELTGTDLWYCYNDQCHPGRINGTEAEFGCPKTYSGKSISCEVYYNAATVCVYSGTVDEGAACGENNYCKPGLTCQDLDGTNKCYRFCETGTAAGVVACPTTGTNKNCVTKFAVSYKDDAGATQTLDVLIADYFSFLWIFEGYTNPMEEKETLGICHSATTFPIDLTVE